jgi:hypothetical protein
MTIKKRRPAADRAAREPQAGMVGKLGLQATTKRQAESTFLASELAVQRAIFQHIAQRGVPGLVAFHCPNENTRNIGQGLKRGVADVILLHDSRFYALELKVGGRVPSVEQLAFIDDVNRAGGYACWCSGLDAAIRILESWHLLRGRST